MAFPNPNGTGNFQSLLESFQNASGLNPNSNRKPSSSSSKEKNRLSGENNASSSTNSHKTKVDSKRMTERISKLWHTTMLRHSMKVQQLAVDRNSENMNQGDNFHKNSEKPRKGKLNVHIAVCLCIVDNLTHENIWKRWMMESNTKDKYTKSDTSINKSNLDVSSELYIHAKHPEKISSEWTRTKLISKSFRPNWNDVRVVRAMLSLIEHALEDEKTTHIVLGTESCIPIAPLEKVAETLLQPSASSSSSSSSSQSNNNEGRKEESEKDKYAKKGNLNWNQSFIDCYNRHSSNCTRFDEGSCFDVLSSSNSQNSSIPSEAVYKALPGWITICRKHAEDIIDLPKKLLDHNENDDLALWPLFENVWAPEEVYFPTILALTGALLPIHNNNNHSPSSSAKSNHEHFSNAPVVIPRSLTWSKWDTHARNHRDRARPFTYDGTYFNADLVHEARNVQGCIFLRKVKQHLDVHRWEKIIYSDYAVSDSGAYDSKRIATHKSSLTHSSYNDNKDYDNDDSLSSHTSRYPVPNNQNKRKCQGPYGAYTDNTHRNRHYSNDRRKRYNNGGKSGGSSHSRSNNYNHSHNRRIFPRNER